MRLIRVAVLAICAATSLGLSAQDPVLLRRTFKPNTQDKYTIASDAKQTVQTPFGDQDMEFTSSMTYTLSIGDVGADGIANVILQLSDVKVDTSQPVPHEGMPTAFKATAKLDPRMTLSELKLEGDQAEARRSMQMLAGTIQSLTYPEQAIKIGDTWIWTMPKNSNLGDQEFKIKVRFDGEREVEGAAFYVLTIEDTLPLDIDLSKVPDAQASGLTEGRVKGTQKMKMEVLIEKATGRVFSSTGTTWTDTTISIPQLDSDLVSKAEIRTTVKLVP